MREPHSAVRVESPTEEVNPRTVDIDIVPTSELLRMLHAEDAQVPAAVAHALPVLARVVDEAVARVQAGGRVHYFGAGTSGRLAVLDAAELLPTFGMDDGLVVAHQAGGDAAFNRPVEEAEDDEATAASDAAEVTAADLVIGLTASGRTPYVGRSLAVARAAGACTVLVSSNPAPELTEVADHVVIAPTGPEAITGSTRLKAGTAQKLILNAFSTALMVRLGRTYRNLMVDLRPTNAKLRGRSVELLVQATGNDTATCRTALDRCGDLKTALLCLLADPAGDLDDAAIARGRAALATSGGRIRDALALL